MIVVCGYAATAQLVNSHDPQAVMDIDASTSIAAKRQQIAVDVRIGRGVKISADDLRIGAGVVIADDVTLTGESIVLEAGACIGSGSNVSSKLFTLGFRSRIDAGCWLGAVGGAADEIRFGDLCLFGASNRAFVPVLWTGDYVKIHNHTLINGLAPCYLGHNSWVGQNCVLNANAVLFIGNNVGIGTYSSIWTHAFFGELLEGFLVHTVTPTVLEDDCWLLGAYNVVSPGVTIGRKAMVLTSSVVAKDVPPGHTVGGIPARDVTERVPAVRAVSESEKLTMMQRFVGEFLDEVKPGLCAQIDGGFRVTPERTDPFTVSVRERLCDGDIADGETALVYALLDERTRPQERVTFFDLRNKTYTKQRSEPEIQIISFMTANRARFIPAGHERIGVIPATRR